MQEKNYFEVICFEKQTILTLDRSLDWLYKAIHRLTALLVLFSQMCPHSWYFDSLINWTSVNLSRYVIKTSSPIWESITDWSTISPQDPHLSREQGSFLCVFVGRSKKREAFQLMSCNEQCVLHIDTARWSSSAEVYKEIYLLPVSFCFQLTQCMFSKD